MLICSSTDMLFLIFRWNCRFHNILNQTHFISGIVLSWNKSCRVMIQIGLPLRKMQRFCDISKIYHFVVSSYSAQFPWCFSHRAFQHRCHHHISYLNCIQTDIFTFFRHLFMQRCDRLRAMTSISPSLDYILLIFIKNNWRFLPSA